jgi:hypothetical protein
VTDPTEQQLRELFASEAAGAPGAGGLAALALHTARRRRRAGMTRAALLVAAVVAVGGGTVAAWDPAGSADSDAAAPTGVGELPGSATADCQGYSVVGLAAHLSEEGAFAFDGTVTGVEPGADLGPEMPRQYERVTFRVESWYAGGSEETVDVLLDGPDTEDSDVSAYGTGTRLLVSGVLAPTEPASGASTVPEDMALFGFSCGYSRYHDEATAAEWAAIAAGELPAGPLPTPDAVTCPAYSPALVAGTDFALDGTVTEIGEQRFPPVPEDTDSYFSLTLQVHAWYRGGTGGTVTIHLSPTSAVSSEGYAQGTRLLVSGVLSDVEGRGLIGQGCGFTRYHDEATAAEWAAATD